MLARSGVLLLMVADKKHINAGADATEDALRLAKDLIGRAMAERDDQPNFPRYLALAHWLAGEHSEAIKVLDRAAKQTWNERYGPVTTEYDLLAAEIDEDKRLLDGKKESSYRFRVTLDWESDANDVDLHAFQDGAHCFYSQQKAGSMQYVLGDQTQGLGPEAIVTPSRSAIEVGANLFSAGAFSVARGVLVVTIRGDGQQRLLPHILPFAVSTGSNTNVVLGTF